jgi:Cof subfamily protein (haloacid dehalogenase superfamily)
MTVKLLALDLDGTLLNSDHRISERNAQAVRRAQSSNVMVIVMTGRRFRSALPYAQELDLNHLIVVHNGALIKSPATGAVITCTPLSLATCYKVVHLAKAHGVDPVVTIGPEGYGTMVIDRIDDANAPLARYLSISSHDVLKVDDLVDYLKNDPIQITFSHRPEKIEFLMTRLEAALCPEIKLLSTVYLHRDLSILDVVNPSVSKGQALAAVAGMYGFAREEVMAVGDNFNDLDMLKYAGISVVMGNADRKLKDLGFAVTASNDDSGVADAIERYVLLA